jgi:tetratricopeptide (TPR) repeat protein
LLREGDAHQELGAYRVALRRYQDALELHQAALVTRPTDVSCAQDVTAAMSGVGQVFEHQGQYIAALAQFEAVLKLQLRYADLSRHIFITKNNMGRMYELLGRYTEALEKYQEALRGLHEQRDPESQAIAVRNIGSVYASQGKYTEALEKYHEALSVQRAALGDSHPSVAATLNNIGSVYSMCNK